MRYSGTDSPILSSQQSGRSREEVGANDGREDFDGTDASLPEENRKSDVASVGNPDDEKTENSQSEEPNNCSEGEGSADGTPDPPTPKTIYHGPSRKDRTYNKHMVGTLIIHKCDLSHLPEGVTYRIKKNPKKILHTITKVEEHWFEEVAQFYEQNGVFKAAEGYLNSLKDLVKEKKQFWETMQKNSLAIMDLI